MNFKKSKEQQEYEELVKSGMFWEFYPNLLGDWIKDKSKWSIEYKKLLKSRK